MQTRFNEFDDRKHKFNKWWQKHGQYMLSGGGQREMIWAARGWIAREQLEEGVPVTGEAWDVENKINASTNQSTAGASRRQAEKGGEQ